MMTITKKLAPTLLLLTLNALCALRAPLAHADPVLLAADPVKTTFVGVARNHAVLATRWFAVVRIDRKDFLKSSLEVSLPVSELELDTAEARRVAQLPSETAPPPIPKQPQLKGDIKWSSDTIALPKGYQGKRPPSLAAPLKFTQKAKFTLNGRTRAVSIPSQIEPAENDTFRITGKFTIQPRDYGFGAQFPVEVRFDITTQPETVVASL